jgi:hypothetical protein
VLSDLNGTMKSNKIKKIRTHVTDTVYRTGCEFIYTEINLHGRNALPCIFRDTETHARCAMFSASVSTTSK